MPVIGITGKPKRGKTVSACTFPKPALLIDIMDRGFDSVKNTRNKDGSLVVPDWEQITVIEIYPQNQRSKMTFKSFASENDKSKTMGNAPEYTAGATAMMERYEAVMDELFSKGTVTVMESKVVPPKTEAELVPVEKGPFKTLIIDPLTGMFRIWKDAILSVNRIGDLRRGDYLALESILANQFIPNLKSLCDKIPYIILTDHEDADITEQGTIMTEYPVGPSKSLGKNLSEFMDNVWRMDKESDGTYVWRTKEHGLFRGAGSRWDLPDPVKPATFAALEKILKAREVIKK